MKVVITHLKAPWPEGAKPSDVCELPGDSIPGWATGKCTEAAGDAEAQFAWEPPAPPVEAEAPKAADPDALASLTALLDAEKQASAELGTLLEAERAKVASLTAERDAALAELEALKAGGKGAKTKG